MKEFKGTKGEWKQGYGTGLTGRTTSPTVYFDGNEITEIPISSGKYAICWILKDGELDYEEKANAKLIAAAPELLEALQVSLKLLILEGWNDDDGSIQLIKKAISKALN